VKTFLKRHFPELGERYRRILFSPTVRQAYLEGIRRRVERAADRFRLTDRVAGCL